MHPFLEYFYIYSYVTVLIPVTASLIRFKRLEPPIQYLAILIFLDFLTEVVSHIVTYLKVSNHFLWPIFISLEFGLLAWIYRFSIRPMFLSNIIPIAIIVFTGYVFIDWFVADVNSLSHIPRFVESTFVLYFVLSFFYKTLKSLDAIHLERQPMFWLSVGLFIYFSGDIIIFIFSDYIQSYSRHLNLIIWNIHAILNIVLYIFYTLAICLTPKKLN